MQVIITGVAGYIGAHVANIFLESGYEVVGIDNLSTGFEKFIDSRIQFIKGDIQNEKITKSAFSLLKDKASSGVIHCAGLKFAGESINKPLDFYESNTMSNLQILKSMKEFEVRNLVFSSSCSIYGDIKSNFEVSEVSTLNPISPYGRSKKFAEEIISDFAAASTIKAVALRYFNVAGNGNIIAHDASPFNLFPNLYRAIQNKTDFNIYGNDYSTPDGTCVRDYVDVNLISKAHFDVYSLLNKKPANSFEAYNLGSGIGTSVGEIIEKAKKYLVNDLKITYSKRREGDPSHILASIDKAKIGFGWTHESTCDEMLIAGWNAWQRNNNYLESH